MKWILTHYQKRLGLQDAEMYDLLKDLPQPQNDLCNLIVRSNGRLRMQEAIQQFGLPSKKVKTLVGNAIRQTGLERLLEEKDARHQRTVDHALKRITETWFNSEPNISSPS